MENDKPSPFAELLSAVGWLALALAIIVLSWRMDRLERFQASIYSAPGLVPGLLGAALALMAVILGLRAVQAGALSAPSLPRIRLAEHWRFGLTLVLSLVFAIGLVGSGLPFWIAGTLFVAIFVFVFRLADERGRPVWRSAAFSVLYGTVAGLSIHYVFQDLFLVRLP